MSWIFATPPCTVATTRSISSWLRVDRVSIWGVMRSALAGMPLAGTCTSPALVAVYSPALISSISAGLCSRKAANIAGSLKACLLPFTDNCSPLSASCTSLVFRVASSSRMFTGRSPFVRSLRRSRPGSVVRTSPAHRLPCLPGAGARSSSRQAASARPVQRSCRGALPAPP